MPLARVIAKPRRARPFFARHPWVFAGSIGRVDGEPAPGDEVEFVSHEGIVVARGLYNPHSAIRVRLYRWDPGELDDAFWRARLSAAVELRAGPLGLVEPGTACRLVFSEADGLSGLTVDRFDRWLVVQFTSLALALRRDRIVPMLAELTGCEGVWLRFDRTMAEHEGMAFEDGPALGSVPEAPVTVRDGGLIYEVDVRGGQKTGLFLDQRENRLAVARYAAGRRVLDLFCYSGGFGLSALKHGGAEHALGFDRSSSAIAQARRNAVANGLGAARFEESDAFEALESLRDQGRRFGLVVCDPPKFARGQKDLQEALRGYLRLNRLAVDVLEPGGVLATCSCSGLVDRTMFTDVLGRVAELSGRPIQLLEQRGAAPDHPVSASCQETDYLKCVICRVS